MNRPIDEQKILQKGLLIFAKIIAQEMMKDGVGQNGKFGHKRKRNSKQCKVQKQKLVA